MSKRLIEAVTGRIAFEPLHFGQLRFQIAVCTPAGFWERCWFGSEPAH